MSWQDLLASTWKQRVRAADELLFQLGDDQEKSLSSAEIERRL